MMFRQIKILVSVVLLLLSSQALADAAVIQSLQDEFRAQTRTWFGPLENIATWLLISLATISWTWSAGQMVLRNADFQEFMVELVRLVIFVGFFLALIINADTWSTALINGFIWSGDQATGAGITGDLNPAAILERGFILSSNIIEASGTLTFLAFAIVALFALALYALIAAYTMLVMAEMYIVTAAGVLLLGFGGSQWTADYAKRYISYCVSVGAKLYVIFLVVGLGEQFVYRWAINQDKSQFVVLLSIIGVLIMLVILVKMIPDLIQGIINGASMGNGTPSIAGMAAALGSTAAGVATGVAGGLTAVNEASKLATAQLGGDASSGSKGGGGGSSLGGGSLGNNKSPLPMPGGGNASGAALGGAGRMAHAGQTMKNLAKAAGGALGERMTRGTFGESMAQKLRAEKISMLDEGGNANSTGDQGGMSGSMGPGSAGEEQEKSSQSYHSPAQKNDDIK